MIVRRQRWGYILFLPLVGFIAGAVLLSKNEEYKKEAGKTCLLVGGVSSVINIISIGIIRSGML